jgi:hypothetical protein
MGFALRPYQDRFHQQNHDRIAIELVARLPRLDHEHSKVNQITQLKISSAFSRDYDDDDDDNDDDDDDDDDEDDNFYPCTSGTPPLTTAESLQTSLGMSASALKQRLLLVQHTNALQSPPLQPNYRFAQGIPDFMFPSFNSWVRFNFDSMNNASEQLWSRGRVPLQSCGKPRCSGVFRTQNPSHSCIRHRQHDDGRPSHPTTIVPARACVSVLRSIASLRYQVAARCGRLRSFALNQYNPFCRKQTLLVGKLCYTLPTASWSGPGRLPSVVYPGYVARAQSLGYRDTPPPPLNHYNSRV